ncbi:hypothetical protein Emed_005691 [Eimeria media]
MFGTIPTGHLESYPTVTWESLNGQSPSSAAAAAVAAVAAVVAVAVGSAVAEAAVLLAAVAGAVGLYAVGLAPANSLISASGGPEAFFRAQIRKTMAAAAAPAAAASFADVPCSAAVPSAAVPSAAVLLLLLLLLLLPVQQPFFDSTGVTGAAPNLLLLLLLRLLQDGAFVEQRSFPERGAAAAAAAAAHTAAAAAKTHATEPVFLNSRRKASPCLRLAASCAAAAAAAAVAVAAYSPVPVNAANANAAYPPAAAAAAAVGLDRRNLLASGVCGQLQHQPITLRLFRFCFQGVDFVCGALDAFAYTVGLSTRNVAETPKVYCSNPKSKACAGIDEINEAIEQDRPAGVQVAGISCHPRGTAFALVFTDGTVLAFGEELQGGSMNEEATNGLGRFEAGRVQRVKRIVATTGAFAVLLQNGSVFAWGDSSVGGQLPNPEPTNITDIMAADVGFVAMTGSGGIFTWGKGVVLPSQITNGGFVVSFKARTQAKSSGWRNLESVLLRVQAESIWAEKTCFAAISKKGKLQGLSRPSLQTYLRPLSRWGARAFFWRRLRFELSLQSRVFALGGELAVWGTSTSTAPFCVEGLSASGNVSFESVKSKLATGVKMVRFNEKAGVAARIKGENEAFPGTWEVIAWGDPEAGATVGNGVSSVARKGVKSLHATNSAFLVINEEGQAAAWGDESSGGATLPVAFTYEHQVAGVSELLRSFAIVFSSGEALITGQSGLTLISKVTLQNLTSGTSIVRGFGSGCVFVAAIGTPCIPGYWASWGLCSGSCLGSRTRERDIAYSEQHGGSCDSTTVDIEACAGIASEECSGTQAASSSGEVEADTSSSTSTTSSALSLETILGFLVGVVGLVIVVGTVIYLWKE